MSFLTSLGCIPVDTSQSYMRSTQTHTPARSTGDRTPHGPEAEARRLRGRWAWPEERRPWGLGGDSP